MPSNLTVLVLQHRNFPREHRAESNFLSGNPGNITYLPIVLTAPLVSLSLRVFGPYATQFFIA
jgi:hypothetical protein